MTTFEDKLKAQLHQYLSGIGVLDQRLPECPDIEHKWREIAEAYLTDGVREFNEYPEVSLGWMMFIGMAIAHFWDSDWQHYSAEDNIYAKLRDARGYDYMDEYIIEKILKTHADKRQEINDSVSHCASIAYSLLRHEQIEPGTPEAFKAYVACLHQLYLMGAAISLNALGYHMTLLE